MADSVCAEQRSRIMAAIRSKDTKPEMLVRRQIHKLGYRYRLHVSTLPGKPDIVLPRLRKIVDVRGCYWHLHSCGHCRLPQTRGSWWAAKLYGNARRDRATLRKLRSAGWSVLIVWECQTKDVEQLKKRLRSFLEAPTGS